MLVQQFGGTSGDYVLVAEREIVAGATPLWSAKFLDRRGDGVHLIYRDGSGRIGGPELRRAAIRASRAGLSAMERKSSEQLRMEADGASPDELLPVAVWMDVDTANAVAAVVAAHPEGQWLGDRPNSPDIAIQRQLRRELDAARSSIYQAAAEEIAAAIGVDGGKIGYVSLLAPLVYIDAPARSIARLASLNRVRSLGLEGNDWEESLASAGPEVSADWHTGSLDQGNGVRVGIIEYYNVRETGDLAGKVVAFHSESGSTMYTPSGSFDHPTWVAGAVASQDATDKGIAPGAVIVSSGTGGGAAGLTRDRNVIEAADWAATTGDADIINLSVNMDNSTGRDEARAYFDALGGGESYRTVVASSGNYGSGVDASWWVSSPGTSWNVLTVGGMNDATNQLWYDGSCPCSGAQYQEHDGVYYNPHGDFNKPDVTAPAVSVRTANGLSNTGTSVAAPIVSGIAAQLFARDAATFTSWPEAMRAIIMAGANRRVPLPGGGTSTEHEGVGTVNAMWAHRIFSATYGGWAKGTMAAGDSVTRTFSVTAGQKVRVVLTWDSDTSGTMFDKTDTLAADLDLIVTYPGGSSSSLSYDNASEFVSFTAPTTGTVTIRISQARFDNPSEYWSLAWLKW